ncbi:MAG: hypothetical protein ACE5EE_01430 [Fidelibacterota bacterium]
MKQWFLLLIAVPLLAIQDEGLTVPGYDCQDCHGAEGWDVLTLAGFSHQLTSFPLGGTHRMQPCSVCHEGTSVLEKHQFQLEGTTCVDCHIDVHQSTLGGDCQQCHGDKSWQVTTLTFDHETTQFSLLGAHRSVACQLCHTERPMTVFSSTPIFCYECHRSDYDAVDFPSHKLAQLNTDCEICHSPRRNSWLPSDFDHNSQTAFILDGVHRTTQCADCHEGIFAGTPQDCWSCHEEEYTLTGSGAYPNAPSHTTEAYSQNCEYCHSTASWLGAEMNHDLTEFPLTGLHQNTDCASCHGLGNYDLPLECEGCHIPGGISETNYGSSAYDHPNHGIADDCIVCHTTSGWEVNLFTHSAFTENLCLDCHQFEYDETEDPPHSNGNISDNCSLCHTTENWGIELFEHLTEQTGYTLIGAHAAAACIDCHVEQMYSGTPQDCANSGCHLSNFEATNNPDHNLYGYPANYCDQCHNTFGWSPHIFTHGLTLSCATCHMPDYENASTPLHLAENGYSTSCDLCHTTTDTWAGASFDHAGILSGCVDCHLSDHSSSADPPHGNGNIGTSCELCHGTESWVIDPFEHSSEQTNFSLVGLHIPVPCINCHVEQMYNGTPQDCANSGCHLSDFESTTNPDHGTYGYPSGYCDQCHNEYGWSPHIYTHGLVLTCATCHLQDYESATNPPHSEQNGFTTTCETCHSTTDTWVGATFAHEGITSGCVDCHLNDYNNATDPPHSEEIGFSQTCENCHTSTETWEGANFSHVGITSGCVNCHLADYNNASDPPHSEETGFSQTCENCHTSTETWEGATFVHEGITSGCVNCHLTDYNSTNHASNGYPTACEVCHTSTTNWSEATFDHDNDWFPIYTGEHSGEWSTCTAECHIVPEDYSDFSCGLNGVCHKHDQSKMDDKHSGTSNYVYESWACYECHPTGDDDDGDGDGDDKWQPRWKKLKPQIPWIVE